MFLVILQALMKASLGPVSSHVRRSKRLRAQRTPQLSRHDQRRQLLADLLPAVIADIIGSYASRPHVGAFDVARHTIQIFTGDWESPPRSIFLETRLPALLEQGDICEFLGDICEFLGGFVVIARCVRGWMTLVVDNNSNTQKSSSSRGSRGRLVQLQGTLYAFGTTHFAVFDHHAKCFLPDTTLPPGYSEVRNVCVFKGLLYLLLLKNGLPLRLTSFNSDISKWKDEGTFPEVSVSQMCANDKNIFFYYPAHMDHPCCWGRLLTWNPDTGFTAPDRVANVMQLITCDNDYIYFVNSFNIVVRYDIATKQLVPDPAPIEDAARMWWFGIFSATIF